eukprot:7522669-Alexandrium_andersonii.AAC.1
MRQRNAPSAERSAALLGRAVVFAGEAWAEEPDARAELREQAQRGRRLHRGDRPLLRLQAIRRL